MEGLEEEFSPEKWTQKELVKHLYREVSSMNIKLDAMNSGLNDRYNSIESQLRSDVKELDARLDSIEQFKASTETSLTVLKVVAGAVISGIVGLLLKLFVL